MTEQNLEQKNLIEAANRLVAESKKETALIRKSIQRDKENCQRICENIAKMKNFLSKLKTT